jgi:hypothetical protein
MPAETEFADFASLFDALTNCRRCRDVAPSIASLSASEFKFHWQPYLRGKLPLRYVFLGWEPSWPPTWDKIDEGTFSKPLQFAIREFLLAGSPETGFLITNMAQCSMKTGVLCNETREVRFRTCSEFLKEQVRLASHTTNEISLISIGREPMHFLQTHSDLYKMIVGDHSLHRITHYSPRCNPHFHRFAKERSREFEEFMGRIRPKYEQFIQEGDFSDHWDWYTDNPANSRSEFQRLFKWQCEMRDIRLS